MNLNSHTSRPVNPFVIVVVLIGLIAVVIGYVLLTREWGATSKTLDFAKAITLVPAEWGKVVTSENYSDWQGKISTVYHIDFENNISAVFQEGVGLMAYRKITEQGSCIEYVKRFDRSSPRADYGDSDICFITENGIYNLETQKSVVFTPDVPFTPYDAKVDTAPFTFIDADGASERAVFSPQGKYFA